MGKLTGSWSKDEQNKKHSPVGKFRESTLQKNKILAGFSDLNKDLK